VVSNGSTLNGVYQAQCSSTGALGSATSFADVFAAGLGVVPSQVSVASLSASVAWVFGWTIHTPPWLPTLYWMNVSNTATSTASGSTRLCGNVRPFTKPFFLSNRLYMGLQGMDSVPAKSDYGFVLCEFDTTTASSVAQYTTPMPVAAWATDASDLWDGNGGRAVQLGCVSGNAWYSITGIIFGTRDIFTDNAANTVVASTITYHESGFRLMKLDFADSKRWQAARHGDSVVFAGAVPFSFEGTHAFECGFLWRPAIISVVKTVGGGILPTEEMCYRVTYEYWDTQQRRWNSTPNNATEGLMPAAADYASNLITVRIPTITCMPRGGFYFFGGIRVSLWRSVGSAPDEYLLIGQETIQSFASQNITFTDVTPHDDSLDHERMYTWGGELENGGPPPCRALVAHRDRMFAINTETNELWYTKPLMNGRGAEWSRYQKLPLFDKGMALGATEGGLIILTKGGVYALQGSGPSITGNPPDAFSKLYKISGEIGCVELNAAFSTPVGVIFRGRQGLWLVDKSMSLKYIGAPVEEFMADVTEMLSGDVDEKKGVVRMLCYDGAWKVLNYWYDTNRWSYDTTGGDTVNSAVCHNGYYYQSRTVSSGNMPGVWKNTSTANADDERFYAMKVTTHWLRFGNMAQTKRVWRVLANVNAEATSSLQMTIYRNNSLFDPQTETFLYATALSANYGKNQPRVHLENQKVTSLKVRLQEVEEGSAGTAGFELLGLAFELGLKRGAVKMKSELSK
jgi:hypothetical protein